jgi:hypothetical protein
MYYKKDYTKLIEESGRKNVYACSVVLINGEELFSYLTEIEDGVFFLQDPLKIIRMPDTDGTPMIIFKKYNYFSDDTTMILKESSIVSIGYLAEVYIDAYKNSIESIKKKTEIAVQKAKEILTESASEEGDRVVSLFRDAKKPTLLN